MGRRRALAVLVALVVAAHAAHAAVEQLMLTRTAERGLALTWVAYPPASALPSAYVVHYGPPSAPFSLSALPSAALGSAAPDAWPWSGTVLYAPLIGLAPDTDYAFALTDAASGRPLTPTYTVRAPPDPSDEVRLLAAANTGASADAASVAAAMARVVHASRASAAPVAALLLPGEQAFGGNAPAAWDAWATQLSPLATAVPVLSAPGAAELAADATGAAYRTRLGNLMPNVSAALPFSFSDALGRVHVAALSTDTPLAAQLAWLDADLAAAAAARAAGVTHFLVVMGSAPAFSSNAAAPEPSALRAALLPLLARHGVDLALWGQVAAYERTRPITLNASSGELVFDSVNGTVHLSLGSGGRPVDATWSAGPAPAWSARREAELGFVVLTAYLNRSLHVQFVRANGSEGDSAWLTRPAKGAAAGAVLLIASVASLAIIGVAAAVAMLLMRGMGGAPAVGRYDALNQVELDERATAGAKEADAKQG